MSTAIDRLYDEATAVIELLHKGSETSLQVAAADHFRKALFLAVASHFEDLICNCVLDFVRERANGSSLVESFVRNKAIARQYHTWFAWGENNANQFYGLFGSQFRTAMMAQISETPELRNSVKAFLELGNERNRLVHQNYATFLMEKTLDEIYGLYKDASRFVDLLPRAFRDCEKSGRSGPS
jgi:RiboL-PSP-HEPN